ncbi:MAG: bifunctional hydroxymethylpyrimidine kinase/phosphomethylpyrimidine kinase [Rubrivivax sp. SCN 70-15]|nr:MAG: bifunctional hydroxymethylpyrimidine kinase/phosphomethylpyrimidine kinase [Rubrivivax sp. SCN 70-15]
MTASPSRRYLRLLSIAGSDSGGGAGIQADLKTFAALGGYGMSAITAVTAQNTLGVTAIHAVPPGIVAAQIAAVVGDIGVDAVKIGMLPSAATVQAVAEALRSSNPGAPIVLDPVLLASSGDRLVAPDTVTAMLRELFPLATLVTPNLDEAALLLGRAIAGADEMESAAVDLLALGAPAVLLKGGHLQGEVVTDVLAGADGTRLAFSAPRLASRNLHGTGCTLSSAIAAGLALGRTLPDAVAQARDFLRQAIAAGADVRTGQGAGPLNHGHAPIAMQLRPAAPDAATASSTAAGSSRRRP